MSWKVKLFHASDRRFDGLSPYGPALHLEDDLVVYYRGARHFAALTRVPEGDAGFWQNRWCYGSWTQSFARPLIAIIVIVLSP